MAAVEWVTTKAQGEAGSTVLDVSTVGQQGTFINISDDKADSFRE
jgi:hypothetical protein